MLQPEPEVEKLILKVIKAVQCQFNSISSLAYDVACSGYTVESLATPFSFSFSTNFLYSQQSVEPLHEVYP